jgi:hydroxypyruvate isomerase
MPRFAANLSMLWTELPFLDRFAAAARAGFDAVEFLFPYAHEPARLAELLGSNGLRLVLFNMPPGDWDAGERGLACDPRRAGEFQEGVGRAIAYARALGCEQLHAMAGLRPAGFAEDALRETYVSNLRFAARELSKNGLRLLVEAINTRDIPGFYLTTSSQAFAVMDEVGAENLHFQFDIYHMQIMQGDLAPTIERHLARIGHMQLADTPGRHEPGTGEINYAFLLAHIDRVGYRGHIGCEYKPLGGTEDGLGWLTPWRGARGGGST